MFKEILIGGSIFAFFTSIVACFLTLDEYLHHSSEQKPVVSSLKAGALVFCLSFVISLFIGLLMYKMIHPE